MAEGEIKKQKKQEARRRADRLRGLYEAKGEPLLWFDELYKEADGDAGLIPWGHEEPRAPLVSWLEVQEGDRLTGRLTGRALDVGCGLGHNAVALCLAGFDVTAFDISQTAVDWAGKRFGDMPIEWVQADLLDLPIEWRGRFDLVSETFTLQALKGDVRKKAFEALAALVGPSGRLLIVCRGRLDDEPINPPPWPLTPTELLGFEEMGLSLVSRVDYFDDMDPPNRHFVAEFARSAV